MLHSLLVNFLALTKVLRCLAHLFRGMFTMLLHFGANATLEQKSHHISQWAQRFLRILQVQLHTSGHAVTRGPLLVVANHISWLDVLVLLAAQPVCFVSKSEVKRWPVIGWLATNAGTLYIERASRRDAMRVVHHIAAALTVSDNAQPSIIAVFPEGTTSDGAQVLPFHGNLIQAALSAGAPIQPVSLRFINPATGGLSMTPAYVDDDHLISSVWRLLTSPAVHAQVRFGTPEHAAGRDRRAWAADLQRSVSDGLMESKSRL
jgi:1-acyl-sn-glycerol-3-phosphate acyltransferase